ncbi:MAG TPA: molecular chaperone DnaJ [Acidimicrobiales bacterium]|nr:molecular chaperone DnaJ [Acidimicrobiales bacterium]
MAQPQREWFDKDYYKVLGVSETATENEIRRAYRKLAKQHHPDANPGSEERFKEISAAYDVLSDGEKRKSYDELRRLGPAAAAGFGGSGAPGSAGAPGAAGARNFTFTGDDLGGVFGDLFSRLRPNQGAGPGRGGGQAGPQRGPDLEAELHLSFTDAVNGVTTSVNVTSEAPCHTCHGSGAAPGTSPIICPQCAGRGVLDENQGFFSFSRTCPRCGGRGMIVETPCPTCGGAGVELRPRQVKVRVPAGVSNEQRIRLKGRGGVGRNGGPPGDLYVMVRASSHPLFGRRGNDLTIKVPITFPESALGAEIKVPTLQDAPVTVKIPPGTRSGRTFRVRNRGVTTSKGTGDLLVTVEVAVPTNLSSEERDAIEALAAAATESPRTHLGV